MELEILFLKNLKKLFLIKFSSDLFLRNISNVYIIFWLLFRNIKKNNILGFIIGILIANGNFPFLLKKQARKQIFFLGVKIILRKNYINFIQKFLFLYFTGLESIKVLQLKKKGSDTLILFKQEFPYTMELDIFLGTIMRGLKSNVFNLLLTLHGINNWYYKEVFGRSLGIPLYITR